MKTIIPTGRVLAVVGLMALAGLVIAGPAEGPPKHPEVDGAVTADACDVCHFEVTPEVYAEWYGSAHGQFNVKCFVCHGPTAEDFNPRPTNANCNGCHGDQVETMNTPFMKDKSCFTCHPAHALTAHRAPEGDGGEK